METGMSRATGACNLSDLQTMQPRRTVPARKGRKTSHVPQDTMTF